MLIISVARSQSEPAITEWIQGAEERPREESRGADAGPELAVIVLDIVAGKEVRTTVRPADADPINVPDTASRDIVISSLRKSRFDRLSRPDSVGAVDP
jgi:hypothetical protein